MRRMQNGRSRRRAGPVRGGCSLRQKRGVRAQDSRGSRIRGSVEASPAFFPQRRSRFPSGCAPVPCVGIRQLTVQLSRSSGILSDLSVYGLPIRCGGGQDTEERIQNEKYMKAFELTTNHLCSRLLGTSSCSNLRADANETPLQTEYPMKRHRMPIRYSQFETQQVTGDLGWRSGCWQVRDLARSSLDRSISSRKCRWEPLNLSMLSLPCQ